MYTYMAYLGEEHEDIVNNETDLLITAVGYYRVHTTEWVETKRPNGRGDYQLLYITEGDVEFFFDGKRQILSKGAMVLFRPGDVQLYNMYAEDKPETYWVHFTGSKVGEFLERFSALTGETCFFAGMSTDYQGVYRQMIRELQLQREGYAEMLQADLKRLFLLLQRHLIESKTTKSEILDIVERAAQYFNEHYNEPISIEEYAARNLMTPAWFIRNFKTVMKVSPMQHIIRQRIFNAKILLTSTDHNISEVAFAVGYDNPLYFSRLFRKYTGQSPTEYRKNPKRKTI